MLSFAVIGIGGFSCVLGGYITQEVGVKPVAITALLLSCLCCFISPIMFSLESHVLFVFFLLFWGMVVISDSTLLSTLVVQNAPLELKGTALTIFNSIGFSLTIISIQLLAELRVLTNSTTILVILALGPIFGLIALMGKKGDEYDC